MISYTLTSAASPPGAFAWGFREANTDDVHRIARGICQYVWSACAFEGGYRKESHFMASDWCALDFEDPEYPLAQALREFGDCIHIIGTTKSHQVAKGGLPPMDRFRVMIPWERRITDLAEFRHNMKRAVAVWPIDKKCIDGARFFFPCRDIVSISSEGYLQAVEPAPPPRPQLVWPRGIVSPWARTVLTQPVKPGERNASFYGAAKDLLKAGFSTAQAQAMLDGSPTQMNSATALPAREVINIVRSAVKSMEAADGRKR